MRSEAPVEPSTLVGLLRLRAAQHPERTAFTFAGDDDDAPATWTYAELDRRARAVAATLQERGAAGERVVLLYPPGLDAIAGFFGCLYAGAVAAPSVAPRPRRPSPRLESILADSGAKFCLTTGSVLSGVNEALRADGNRIWTATDALPAGIEDAWIEPSIDGSTLALLQYTSGSTSAPRGVMVTHGNLMHNLAVIRRGFRINAEPRGVFWLPMYHDMGLVGGVLQPIYVGGPTLLMAPASFLQRPIRWLRAVAEHGATISGAPNFAYDLCVDRITPDELATLDLSRWELAFCGAEPIRPETLERFAEAFAPAGFRAEAFYPCYGLAEATLMVSGGVGPSRPRGVSIDSERLREGRIAPGAGAEKPQTLVACGKALLDQVVRIVDPETCIPCPADRVGEIWVSGASIAQGYWGRPEDSARTFGATLAEPDGRTYLRTGDLGFLDGGELIVTGRLKDLIIVNGRNHYPQDLEQSAAKSHVAIRTAPAAAFTVERDGREQLVLVHELDRQFRNVDPAEVFAAVRRAVAEEHDLPAAAVVLVKPLSVPKTSSGKIQRHATREKFLDGSLETVAEWRLPVAEPAPVEPAQPSPATAAHTVKQVERWLVAKIAGQVGIEPAHVDVREPFAAYGLNSVQAVSLAADLEAFVGSSLPPTLIYDYPTIEALARHLGSPDGPEAAEAEATTPADEPAGADPIAVIGLGCRFPGAEGVEAFWALLRDGVDAVDRVPADRWEERRYFHPEPATPGKMNTAWGGFLKRVDQFDPAFFGISPREAVKMDPQQRLLLEVSWEAFEHAGVAPTRLAGSRTGVFVGISNADYIRLQGDDPAAIDAYIGTGNAFSIAANRLSHVYDFRGPSLAVDTACSSSLVSLHLAAQSLRRGECDMAVAGGVNLILRPEVTITFSQARMMASDGRCKTFDAAADGYVRGEGCGLVVLKRLSEAVRDGDRVLAVLKGTAVNHDGRSNGLTAPNGPAQQAVIRQALDDAGATPDQVDYVEAHGTGTALGDPIEFDSLRAVFGGERPAGARLAVGAVKTNIGHLEAAAGIASFIKVVLSLTHEQIPAHLHLKSVSPHVRLDESGFQIPTAPLPWPASPRKRLAGVSSFGFGGANAHVIVEEAPPVPAAPAADPAAPTVLALSARSESALNALAGRYASLLDADPALDLADLAFTANTGRAAFAHRLAITAAGRDVLRERLQAAADGLSPVGVARGKAAGNAATEVMFLFTGQGRLDPGTARKLFETEPAFRDALVRCDRVLRPILERPLLEVLYPEPGVETPLNQTRYAPAALFSVEYALAALWRSLGVEPALVMGHSLGEYVAACVAGAFSLEEGLELVVERSRLMQSLPGDGAMAMALARPERVAAAIGDLADKVGIGAINGPENVVLSGEREAVAAVLDRLKAEGVGVQWLEVSHAYHSPMMEPVLDAFERWGSQRPFAPLQIPLASNVDGRIVPVGSLLDARHWRRHLREAVQFSAGIAGVAAAGHSVFLEIGPNPTLIGLARLTLGRDERRWLPSLQRGRDDAQVFLNSLAGLHAAGVPVDWTAFHRNRPGRRVSLPTYPFERQRYWVDAPRVEGPAVSAFADTRQDEAPRHPLLGARLRSPLKDVVFETRLSVEAFPFLDDHLAAGLVETPPSVWLEMMTAAALERSRGGAVAIDGLTLGEPLTFPVEGSATVQLLLSPDGEARIFSLDGDDWTLRASGHVRILGDEPADPEPMGGATPVELPAAFVHESAAFHIHPRLLDSAIQSLVPSHEGGLRPMGLERFEVFGRGGARLVGQGRSTQTGTNGDTVRLSDLVLRDAAGKLCARIVGFREAADHADAPAADALPADWLYEMVWQPQPRAGAASAAAALAAPSQVVEAVGPRLDALAEQFQAAAYDALMPAFDDLCGREIEAAFTRLGWSPRPGEVVTAAGLATSLGVVDRHHKLLGRLSAILAEEGLLRPVDGGWEVVRTPEDATLADRWRSLAETFPAAGAEIEFARRGGENLAEVLRGECDPLQLLFPNGSFELADRLYRESPGAQVFNGLLLAGLTEAVAAAPADRPLRILEIGAGTGGTTSFVLPTLPADRTEYTFTDLSRLFLMKARESFEAYPFVRYEILDIERDPASQGFERHHYDLILAANVLHATSDLKRTLTHVRSLLAPQGLVVMLEGSRPRRWLDLSFGLTEGWWKFDDADLRPDYPLLSTRRWTDVLTQTGFVEAAAAPGEAGDSILGDQAVILARAGATVDAAPDDQAGPWLIWADQGGVGEALSAELEARGQGSVLVATGDRFLRLDERHVQIDPDRPGDVEQFLSAMFWGERPACRGVVHLWSLDAPPEDATGTAFLDAAQRLGCGSVVPLLQALARKEWAQPPRTWVVTRGAQAVGDACGLTAVSQSPVWGLGRALAHEHPELWGGLVDLDAGSDPLSAASQLVGEITVPDADDQVAFRDGERFAPRMVRQDVANPTPFAWRDDASYLVTGGLGGIGLQVARWMAEQGARNLVLMGRTPLPPRSEWDADGLTAAQAERVAAIREIEGLGARVHAAAIDVADEPALRAYLAETRAEGLPPVRGVFHAAADVQGGTLPTLDAETLARVLRPKVAGSWVLHRALDEAPLDFFVMFSTIPTYLGWLGQGAANYVAANAFLNAMAHRRRAEGLPALSLIWGAWAEVGLAARTRGGLERLALQGVESMPPAQGLDAIGRLLTSDLAEAAVARIDWSQFFRAWPSAAQSPLLQAIALEAKAADVGRAASPVAGSSIRETLRAATEDERPAIFEAYLKEMAAKVLGLGASTLDRDQPLVNLGLDSLMAIELKNRIEVDLGVRVPMVEFLKGPSIAQLMRLVLGQVVEPSAPPPVATAEAEPDAETEWEVVTL